VPYTFTGYGNTAVMDVSVFYLVLGFGVGIMAGLLGVGGGLLMIPCLLFIPSLLALPTLDLSQITGLSAVQATASSLSSAYTHYHHQRLNLALVALMGISAMVGSYVGGVTSAWFAPPTLKLAYVLAAGFALWVYNVQTINDHPLENKMGFTLIQWWGYPGFWRAVLIAIGGGFLSGMLGIGGSVFMIPVLSIMLGLSTYQAIGTASGTVLLISLASVLGKMQVGIIPWSVALMVAGAGLLGGRLGASLTKRLPPLYLRRLLTAMIGLSIVRMTLSLLWK